jgi:hypothetical protein
MLFLIRILLNATCNREEEKIKCQSIAPQAAHAHNHKTELSDKTRVMVI